MSIIEKCTEFSRDFEFCNPELQDKIFQNNCSDIWLRDHMLTKTIDFLEEETNETRDAIIKNFRDEIIDGFGDIAFVAINGIYKEFRTAGDSHDIALKNTVLVLHRICSANLAKKHPDGSILYDNGKVQKPQGWQPPNYDDLL